MHIKSTLTDMQMHARVRMHLVAANPCIVCITFSGFFRKCPWHFRTRFTTCSRTQHHSK